MQQSVVLDRDANEAPDQFRTYPSKTIIHYRTDGAIRHPNFWLRNLDTEEVLVEKSPTCVVQFPAVSATNHALSRLRKFRTWQDNWDGEHAPAPAQANLDVAERLLSLLANTQLEFSVGLDADARPMFNLRSPRWDGYIVVEEGGMISFTFADGDVAPLDGFDLPFDLRSLPSELEAVLPQL